MSQSAVELASVRQRIATLQDLKLRRSAREALQRNLHRKADRLASDLYARKHPSKRVTAHEGLQMYILFTRGLSGRDLERMYAMKPAHGMSAYRAAMDIGKPLYFAKLRAKRFAKVAVKN